jgi:hypothetical protein
MVVITVMQESPQNYLHGNGGRSVWALLAREIQYLAIENILCILGTPIRVIIAQKWGIALYGTLAPSSFF